MSHYSLIHPNKNGSCLVIYCKSIKICDTGDKLFRHYSLRVKNGIMETGSMSAAGKSMDAH